MLQFFVVVFSRLVLDVKISEVYNSFWLIQIINKGIE